MAILENGNLDNSEDDGIDGEHTVTFDEFISSVENMVRNRDIEIHKDEDLLKELICFHQNMDYGGAVLAYEGNAILYE